MTPHTGMSVLEVETMIDVLAGSGESSGHDAQRKFERPVLGVGSDMVV